MTCIVLNDVAWEKFFNKRADVIGQSLKLGDKVYTVIGVMPPGFEFPAVGEWSHSVAAAGCDPRLRRARFAHPDQRGPPQARSFSRIGASRTHRHPDNIAKAYPKLELDKRVIVKRYRDVLTGNVRPALLALQFAVLAVWLIACANVASLLLSRTTGRRREIAIRSAIGAARARLVRQFLTESLVLVLYRRSPGAGSGVRLRSPLKFYLDLYLPLSSHIHIDARVAAALVGFSILSAVLFGLVPALQAARAPAQEALRERTPAPAPAAVRNIFAMRWLSARSRSPCCC